MADLAVSADALDVLAEGGETIKAQMRERFPELNVEDTRASEFAREKLLEERERAVKERRDDTNERLWQANAQYYRALMGLRDDKGRPLFDVEEMKAPSEELIRKRLEWWQTCYVPGEADAGSDGHAEVSALAIRLDAPLKLLGYDLSTMSVVVAARVMAAFLGKVESEPGSLQSAALAEVREQACRLGEREARLAAREAELDRREAAVRRGEAWNGGVESHPLVTAVHTTLPEVRAALDRAGIVLAVQPDTGELIVVTKKDTDTRLYASDDPDHPLGFFCTSAKWVNSIE